MDCLTYMKALELRLPPVRADVEYSSEPDEKAIENLHELQRNRPLKPPGRA